MPEKVAILGGGVAGLSAAHELIERGFDVEVYERQPGFGGKARSIPVPGTGTGGRPDLPGEHGFRFFPGFYKHVTDTMRRIPMPGVPGGTVHDNLRQASQFMIAREGRLDPILVARFPRSVHELVEALKAVFGADLGIPTHELLFFANRLFYLLTTCDERRFGELEHQSWWDFVAAPQMSLAYRRYLATGLTRSLVAMRAEEGSARTVGTILLQLLFDLFTPGDTLDRLLDGPTNEVWIDPWVAYLSGEGVVFHGDARLTGFHLSGAALDSVTVELAGTPTPVVADHYVCAIPVEAIVPLITPAMTAVDPRLGELHLLNVEWMNGIQFYFRDDVPLVHGHTIYIDSPWALTSVSQAQFWEPRLSGYGDGSVRGVLSVDISDWASPGVIYGQPAMHLANAQQIKDEVWEQLKLALNDDTVADLLDQNLVTWFLDPGIQFPNPTTVTNLEPLLVNTVGSWDHRPEATTAIEKLHLAADYVRTDTDLATMEAANEAARRAVNGILAASGSSASPCPIWPLEEPLIFEPLKALDRWRWNHGDPHVLGTP